MKFCYLPVIYRFQSSSCIHTLVITRVTNTRALTAASVVGTLVYGPAGSAERSDGSGAHFRMLSCFSPCLTRDDFCLRCYSVVCRSCCCFLLIRLCCEKLRSHRTNTFPASLHENGPCVCEWVESGNQRAPSMLGGKPLHWECRCQCVQSKSIYMAYMEDHRGIYFDFR